MTQQIIDANTCFGFWPLQRADLSLAALDQIMDRHEVGLACTLSTVGIFYDFVEGNRRTLQACSERTRLLPVGTVDPRHHAGCAAEIAGARKRGLRLFSLFPESQGWAPRIACFRNLADAVLQEGLPLMIECGRPGSATDILQATSLDLPIIFAGVRHTNLAEVMTVMKERPKTYLETHALAGAGSLEIAAAEVGAERLIFGSRSPLHYFSSACLRLKYAGLDANALAAASGGNLAALLGVG